MDRVGKPATRRVPGTGVIAWLRRGSLVVVTILIIEYLVLPKLIGARDDLSLLSSANPALILAAVVLEACSLLSYSALSLAVFRPDGGIPRFGRMLRIDLSGLGLSHVVPGSGATAVALRYRLLTQSGIAPADALAGTAIQAAASVLVLVSIFVCGILLSLSDLGDEPALALAGLVAIVVVTGFGVLVAILMAKPESDTPRIPASSRTRRVLRLDAIGRVARILTVQIRALANNLPLMWRTVGWAFGNWMFDATCLWLCLRAYGHSESVRPLLAVYGAANLLALLPITPGGLGLVEGVLIPALITFGAPHSAALLGVLTWRLAEYWLPIPVSVVTYLSLRVGKTRE